MISKEDAIARRELDLDNGNVLNASFEWIEYLEETLDATKKDKVEYQQEIGMLNYLVGKMDEIASEEDIIIDRLFANIKLKDKYFE